MSLEFVILGLVGLVALYQLYVSVRVFRFPEYSGAQKAIQIIIVWLVPFFGALVAHLVYYGASLKPFPRDENFTPDRVGSGG